MALCQSFALKKEGCVNNKDGTCHRKIPLSFVTIPHCTHELHIIINLKLTLISYKKKLLSFHFLFAKCSEINELTVWISLTQYDNIYYILIP